MFVGFLILKFSIFDVVNIIYDNITQKYFMNHSQTTAIKTKLLHRNSILELLEILLMSTLIITQTAFIRAIERSFQNSIFGYRGLLVGFPLFNHH